MWLFVPSSVEMRVHTSTSGPYWGVVRQAVQVVDFEQASVFEVTLRPVSTPPVALIPFVQPPASGLSLGRSKLSTVTSGAVGRTRVVGVAEASFESEPSPFALTADPL